MIQSLLRFSLTSLFATPRGTVPGLANWRGQPRLV